MLNVLNEVETQQRNTFRRLRDWCYDDNNNSNRWSKYFDNRPHHRRTWTVQWYSPGGASVQCALHLPPNTCFLGPTWVHNPNSISIGSAIFCSAHGTVSSGIPGHVLSLKNYPLAWGDLDPHLIHGSGAHPSPNAKWHLDRFSHFLLSSLQRVPILYNEPTLLTSKFPLPMGGSGPHLIHGSLGPPASSTVPNRISISSAIFAGLNTMTDQQTTLLGQ